MPSLLGVAGKKFVSIQRIEDFLFKIFIQDAMATHFPWFKDTMTGNRTIVSQSKD